MAPKDGLAASRAGRVGRPENKFQNTVLPDVARTTAGLELYTGPWGPVQAAHLLRRTTFGATQADIDTLVAAGSAAAAVDMLLDPLKVPESSQPLSTITPSTANNGEVVPLGSTWVDALYKDPASATNPSGYRTNSLKGWWVGLMLNPQLSLREKMTLFWHNHFVTEMSVVNDPRLSYRYLALLRANCFGNFKDLTRAVTIDAAMLRFLNGNTNTKQSPNENYGRELQELFTIGKGPEVAPGDYTNYSEQDVKAASHVLSGWRDIVNADTSLPAIASTFDATKHDTTNKQFSADYAGSNLITGGTDGARELDDMLTLIFTQPETSAHICRKFYRWFVYYLIDPTTETAVIQQMASILRTYNFNVSSPLSALLKSAHFYDPVNIGCMIKSPIDLIVGTCRTLNAAFPSSADTLKSYTAWYYLAQQSAALQMNIGDPPDVAGWKAYYQTPQYYELWINSDTLPKRSRFTDTVVKTGINAGNSATITLDVLAIAKSLSNPNDPNVIVAELAARLFALPPTTAQLAFLKETLLPGLPDYEWTTEWTAYLADPANTTKKNAVKSKLAGLIAFMMEMPEYQLS